MRALSRKTASRKSLLRNLATSLVLYERIETTEAKAKEVKPEIEHILALAKKNDLASRRRMLGYFFDENATKKVIEVLVPRYNKISSGFIKTYRKGKRLGDGAMIMIMELQKGEVAQEVAEIKEINKEGKDDSNAKRTKIGQKASSKTGQTNSRIKTATSKKVASNK